AADLRLASIGFRLATAAAPLCDRLEPGSGLQIHTLTQYGGVSRERVRAHFGFAGAVSVEAVVADSPAAAAGVQSDDSIVAINGVPTPPLAHGDASTEMLAGLHRQIAALPPQAPITLDVMRAGRPHRLTLQPVRACFTRFELKIADNFDARA